MSVIFTADFQCEWSNIDRCQEAWEEILHICKKEKLTHICVLGDLKQAMNPVDLRVVKWWQSAIRKAVKLGYKVILLRGNHDMIGNYTGAEDWFSILKRAGAITFSKPGTCRISDDITLTLIPYLGVNETRVVARNAQETLSRNTSTTNILCFHQDITGAKYNQQGSKSDGKLTSVDFGCSNYKFAVGGHIHLPQLLDGTTNTYYVGSPFCHDWGEVNSRKRYLVVNKRGLHSEQSYIPRWYDPDVGGFKDAQPKIWKGSHIRLSVSCDASQDYGRRLEGARRKAEKKYRGAEIFVVPRFMDNERRDISNIRATDTDERKIREYINQSGTKGSSRLIKYMLKVLSQFEGGLRPACKVKFKRAIGENFLSFKRLDIDLSKKGITLIQGINEDRSKKSNGCVAKGTLIDIPRNLRKYPLGIPIEALVGTMPYVYCYDSKTKSIGLRKASKVVCTGTKPVVGVKFDSDKRYGRLLGRCNELVLTSDHLVMLRNGSYKKAGQLLSGDRLMPLYRKCMDGNYFALHLNNGTSELEHRFILSELYGNRPIKTHGHHRNEKKYDNSITNLQWKKDHKHQSDHATKRNLDGTFGSSCWTNGHPKGMKGKHQTDYQRKIASKVLNSPEVMEARWLAAAKIRAKTTIDRIKRFNSIGMTSEVLQKFLNDGISISQIARHFKLSREAVYIARTLYDLSNHTVKSVAHYGKSLVYDIQVPGTHNFVANGVVVHNSGKTSAMQLLPVSLFGKTFKEQKSDAWSNRWIPKEPAFAEIILKNVDGKVIKVIRGRRPPLLKMYVDGKEVSSGMRSTDKDGTQQQIEKVTGFTWQTLANAVYIDRTVADAFLSGTNKQRTDVLSKFQQLERFEKALEQVKKDQQHCDKNINYYDGELQQTRTSIKHVIEAIVDLQSERGIQIKNVKTLYQRAKAKRLHWEQKHKVKIAALEVALDKLDNELSTYIRKANNWKHVVYKAENAFEEETKKLDRIRTLKEKDTCPTCLQSVDTRWMKTYTRGVREEIKYKTQKLKKHQDEYCKVESHKAIVEGKYKQFEEKLLQLQRTQDELKLEESTLRRQYNEAARKVKESSTIIKQKQRLKKLKRKKLEIKSLLKKYKKQRRMYEYVKEAFSRDGIPAFLNRQLCPVLNKAAAYYASLFSESEIQVRFDVEEGEFIPRVINVRGGSEIEDQSTGERALAGLIASFALREVAPSCNLLILDEPGEGLDAQTAKQFARSLQTLVKRFQAIWVCTHNVHILSELEGERIVTIRKRNRISRVEAA